MKSIKIVAKSLDGADHSGGWNLDVSGHRVSLVSAGTLQTNHRAIEDYRAREIDRRVVTFHTLITVSALL